MKVLWGDYYVDPQTQQITTTPTGKRVFSEYIYKPMKNLFDAIIESNVQKYTNILNRFDHQLQSDEKELTGSELYKKIFRRIYSLAPVLKRAIVKHLPSPITAQKYRVDVLYDGPLDESDPTYLAIKNCDPNGPLMFYTSLMVPADKNGGSRFNTFGRIFSGTIKAGDKVTIMGENFEPGKNRNVVFGKNVQKVIKMVASKTYTLESASSGQIIALCGIDQYLLKSGTVTSNAELKLLYPIKTVKFVVSPVVRIAITPKNIDELPKLIEGMSRLSKSDPIIECTTSDSGENIIACVGELNVSEPVISFRETITELSGITCLKKSANKHNRVYMQAEPLPEELVCLLESGEYGTKDMAKLSKMLVEKFGWDKHRALKI
jgi:elongation factor 2